VHAGNRVAHRHRAEGVAVVAAAQADEVLAGWLALRVPVLDGHLHGDLNRYRTGIGKEHRVQRLRCQFDQFFRQANRRFMRQAAEHNVRHGIDLCFQRCVYLRMVVAVDGAPPGRHTVDQLAAVGKLQAHATGRHHRVHRQLRIHRAVGMPDMVPVYLRKAGEIGHYGAGCPDK